MTLPVLTLTAVSAVKPEGTGAGPATPFTFNVSRTGDLSGVSSVTWFHSNYRDNGGGFDPHADNSDFNHLFNGLLHGTLTWAPNEINKTITINVVKDSALEPDEYFSMHLGVGPMGATISPTGFYANGLIQNDDTIAPPVLTIAAASADKAEGSSGGARPFTFTVNRTGADLSGTSSVQWELLSSYGAFEPGTNSNDFIAGQPVSGTLNWAAGQTSKTITINVAADTVLEQTESFQVHLRSQTATGATVPLPSSRAVGIIRNDDTTAPDLDAYALELSRTTLVAGGSTTVSYAVDNHFAAAPASTVGTYRSVDAVFDASDVLLTTRSTPALGVGIGNGSFVSDSFALTLSTVGTYYIIAVADYGHAVAESNETNNPTLAVKVTVSAPPPPVVAITAGSANKAEGSDGGATPFTFTATRIGNTSGTSSVNWQVFQGATATVDGSDFLAGNLNGTVNFAAGQTQASITVKVRADNIFETSENFSVGLTGATGATINQQRVAGVIRNDDFADLTCGSLVMTGSTLSYRVGNTGQTLAAASTTGIYLTGSSTIKIGNVATPALAAGAFDLDSVSLAFPTNLTAGMYYIGLVADITGAIRENSEANNASIAIPVFLGNSNANTLNGTAGNNAMCGLGGNDILFGNAGADTLDGGLGNDTLTGGVGNDRFVYTIGGGADVIMDFTEGAGIGDRISFCVCAHILTFADVFAHARQVGANTVIDFGGGSKLTLINVAKTSLHFNDFIYHVTDDFLRGTAGADTMAGGLGNDTYVVNNVGDVVKEGLNEGNDTVLTVSATYNLGANVENLTFTGTGTHTGNGNALANVIIGGGGRDTLLGHAGNDMLIGGAGDDVLCGMVGKDTLIGGAGRDAFVFNAALNVVTNVDTIKGFVVADDTIHLENAIFTRLAAGALAAEAFHIGSAALDATDRIIYHSATGALIYDFNGSAAHGAVRFATISPGLALTNHDFVVI